jgi:hypothetical protein
MNIMDNMDITAATDREAVVAVAVAVADTDSRSRSPGPGPGRDAGTPTALQHDHGHHDADSDADSGGDNYYNVSQLRTVVVTRMRRLSSISRREQQGRNRDEQDEDEHHPHPHDDGSVTEDEDDGGGADITSSVISNSSSNSGDTTILQLEMEMEGPQRDADAVSAAVRIADTTAADSADSANNSAPAGSASPSAAPVNPQPQTQLDRNANANANTTTNANTANNETMQPPPHVQPQEQANEQEHFHHFHWRGLGSFRDAILAMDPRSALSVIKVMTVCNFGSLVFYIHMALWWIDWSMSMSMNMNNIMSVQQHPHYDYDYVPAINEDYYCNNGDVVCSSSTSSVEAGAHHYESQHSPSENGSSPPGPGSWSFICKYMSYKSICHSSVAEIVKQFGVGPAASASASAIASASTITLLSPSPSIVSTVSLYDWCETKLIWVWLVLQIVNGIVKLVLRVHTFWQCRRIESRAAPLEQTGDRARYFAVLRQGLRELVHSRPFGVHAQLGEWGMHLVKFGHVLYFGKHMMIRTTLTLTLTHAATALGTSTSMDLNLNPYEQWHTIAHDMAEQWETAPYYIHYVQSIFSVMVRMLNPYCYYVGPLCSSLVKLLFGLLFCNQRSDGDGGSDGDGDGSSHITGSTERGGLPASVLLMASSNVHVHGQHAPAGAHGNMNVNVNVTGKILLDVCCSNVVIVTLRLLLSIGVAYFHSSCEQSRINRRRWQQQQQQQEELLQQHRPLGTAADLPAAVVAAAAPWTRTDGLCAFEFQQLDVLCMANRKGNAAALSTKTELDLGVVPDVDVEDDVEDEDADSLSFRNHKASEGCPICLEKLLFFQDNQEDANDNDSSSTAAERNPHNGATTVAASTSTIHTTSTTGDADADGDADDGVLILPCDARHRFHRSCATAWLYRRSTCPLCQCNVRRFIWEEHDNENGSGGEGGVRVSVPVPV